MTVPAAFWNFGSAACSSRAAWSRHASDRWNVFGSVRVLGEDVEDTAGLLGGRRQVRDHGVDELLAVFRMDPVEGADHDPSGPGLVLGNHDVVLSPGRG
jgi:hypothetical protein